MTALLAAVVAASLVGSLHCAGMCGAFAAIAMGDPSGSRRLALQAGYHGGRLVGYVSLGVAAGALGALLDLGGVLVGLSRVGMVLAGLTLVAIGALEVSRHLGARFGGKLGALARIPRPAFVTALLRRAGRANHPLARAVAMGSCSALLPCGWLYAFVVTAAGVGSPLSGGLVMAAFWIGTVPILATIGLSTEGLRRVLGARAPVVAGLVVIVLGVVTLAGRTTLDAIALAQRVEATHTRTSDALGVPTGDELPACCSGEGH
ncbi:MAG: sulfite exporter TauE/SafE family protein [Planctomycetota bacterium]